MVQVPGSEQFFPAHLVFIVLDFFGPEAEVLKSTGIKQDACGNIQAPLPTYVLSSCVRC